MKTYLRTDSDTEPKTIDRQKNGQTGKQTDRQVQTQVDGEPTNA